MEGSPLHTSYVRPALPVGDRRPRLFSSFTATQPSPFPSLYCPTSSFSHHFKNRRYLPRSRPRFRLSLAFPLLA
uniref:Uncharacterized protein n=1 Tax=Cucumis sativus TaxID=3659 RepID=A0A0A0LXV1_CUCSA